MHRRLATQVVTTLPLVMRELPFDIPPIREAVQWNIANSNDRPLRWVVERLAAYAKESGKADDTRVVPIAEARRDEIAAQFQHDHPTSRGA
jgi:hypothetical protein